ncbi:MAG: hypothetical protein ACRELG_16275, partial [Gemmataceae bacterium]
MSPTDVTLATLVPTLLGSALVSSVSRAAANGYDIQVSPTSDYASYNLANANDSEELSALTPYNELW